MNPTGMPQVSPPPSSGPFAFAAVSYGVVILAALSLPETRGKELQAR